MVSDADDFLLIIPHKKRVDNGEIAICAAISLSYLPADKQRMVDNILDSSHSRLDIEKRKHSAHNRRSVPSGMKM